MAQYRKRAVVIEAMQFDGGWGSSGRAIVEWAPTVEFASNAGGGFLEIRTLEGKMRADPGDWIIKGVKGEFYPIKPDIFEQTYEPVE